MLIEIQADVALPGLKICRIKAALNYVNAEIFMNEVLSIVDSAPFILRWFILRFDSIDDVDYVGANKLMELADRLGREQVSLVFAEIPTSLGSFLSDSGVLEVVGSEKVFGSIGAALAAFRHCTPGGLR